MRIFGGHRQAPANVVVPEEGTVPEQHPSRESFANKSISLAHMTFSRFTGLLPTPKENAFEVLTSVSSLRAPRQALQEAGESETYKLVTQFLKVRDPPPVLAGTSPLRAPRQLSGLRTERDLDFERPFRSREHD